MLSKMPNKNVKWNWTRDYTGTVLKQRKSVVKSLRWDSREGTLSAMGFHVRCTTFYPTESVSHHPQGFRINTVFEFLQFGKNSNIVTLSQGCKWSSLNFRKRILVIFGKYKLIGFRAESRFPACAEAWISLSSSRDTTGPFDKCRASDLKFCCLPKMWDLILNLI